MKQIKTERMYCTQLDHDGITRPGYKVAECGWSLPCPHHTSVIDPPELEIKTTDTAAAFKIMQLAAEVDRDLVDK